MEFNQCDMKVHVFEINCDCHANFEENFIIDLKEGFPCNFEEEEDISVILRKLSSGSFSECSCVVILFNVAYECSRKIYSRVYRAVAENENLKFVTKLFITRPYLYNCLDEDEDFSSVDTSPDGATTTQQLWENCLIEHHEVYKNLNNHVHVFIQPEDQEAGLHQTVTLLDTFINRKQQALQEILDFLILSHEQLELPPVYTSKATTPGDSYLYQINPALAVIINHRNVNGLSVRKSSDWDVKRLQETFCRKNILHLVLPDGSAEEVRRIMSKIKTFSFRGIKYLYIFVMSHGMEGGNVLGSVTETYSIEDDIIAPLLANKTLADTEKCVMIQACRGTRGSIWESHPDDFVYAPTDTQTQDNKLVKLYATIPGHVAYLYDFGSPVIQQFCEQFKKQFEEICIEDMAEEMEQHLLNHDDYDYKGTWTKIMELCVRPNTTHKIKNEFINREDLQELIREFCEFVKTEQCNKETGE